VHCSYDVNKHYNDIVIHYDIVITFMMSLQHYDIIEYDGFCSHSCVICRSVLLSTNSATYNPAVVATDRHAPGMGWVCSVVTQKYLFGWVSLANCIIILPLKIETVTDRVIWNVRSSLSVSFACSLALTGAECCLLSCPPGEGKEGPIYNTLEQPCLAKGQTALVESVTTSMKTQKC